MSEMNPDLLAVSASLNDLARQIHDKKSATTDPDAYTALNDSLVEVNHRITMIGGLIFSQRSDEIASAASRVQEAGGDLASAIAQIEHMKNFLQTVSGFLGLVDNVIGLARQAGLGIV